jgi:hypothetical protein
MKKITINILAIAFAITTFTSCSKDDETITPLPTPVPTPVVIDPTNFSQTAVSGAQFSVRRWHKSIVFNNKLWVIGGENGSTTNSEIWNSTDGVTWSQITPTGSTFSSPTGGKLLLYNNKLWLVEGFSSGPSSSGNIYNSTDGINWVQVSNSGTKFTARHIFDAIVYDNKMWVIGGLTNSATVGLSDIWSSTDGVNWVQSIPVGTYFGGRYHNKLAVFNNKMYLIGGANNNGSNVYGDVWSTTNGVNWTKETNDGAYFSGRYSHEVVVKGATMYVIGGTDASSWNDQVWKTTDGSTWTQVTLTSSFGARRDFQALLFNNKLCVIGGYNGTFKNDIWMSNTL